MNELLRIALLKEHARDKRLTFFNHLWTWILISGIYYFIFIYSNNPVFDSNNMEFQQTGFKYISIGGF
ncbi:MAG: hypothetical protein LIP01_01015, partial [Tannerellaceae bacterium]|nr:hypothetical protein [Tannerellaceae bacterium]